MKILAFILMLVATCFSQSNYKFISFDKKEYSYIQIDSILGINHQYNGITINCDIHKLPENLRLNRNLTKLVLSSSKLEELSLWINSFIHLDTLIIWNSRHLSVANIDSSLSGLSSLKILELNNVELDSIPFKLFIMNKIQELSLRYNKIRNFPEEINLDSLKVLYLGNNRINTNSNIFTILKTLPDLKDLSLSDNNLNEFNIQLLALPKLEYLSLADNPLVELPQHIDSL